MGLSTPDNGIITRVVAHGYMRNAGLDKYPIDVEKAVLSLIDTTLDQCNGDENALNKALEAARDELTKYAPIKFA